MPSLTTPGRPPTVRTETLRLDRFKGVDLTSGAVNVHPSRSPDAPGMMPDNDGFPSKRPGYETVQRYEGRIWGAHQLRVKGVDKRLIHAGTKLWCGEECLYSTMNAAPSAAVQLGGRLWLLDGQNYLCYDGEAVRPVREIATVPLITIAKAPNGKTGATSYKPVNLLTGRRTESYLGTVGEKDYYLSFGTLADTPVSAEVLSATGDWEQRTENTHFTVDRTRGLVQWKTAPGASPVTGEDNVRITYEVAENEAETVEKCRFCILYGVTGALDRIFMAGNPDEPNIDRWSEWNDPAYMGDTFYGALGQEASPIVGYGILGDKLLTHKQYEENDRNIFVRAGETDEEGFALFPITSVLQGEGAAAPGAFAALNGEPLLLTRRGVCALAASDITGERYAQNRSYFINAALTRRPGSLPGASAACWGRFYVLALDGALYLLDGEQKSYEAREPYSSYQYEAYYWPHIPARLVWVWDDALHFGTDDGRVCRFKASGTSQDYSDDGVQYACWWTTPLLHFGQWGRTKTVTGVWAVSQPYARSSGEIFYTTDRENAQRMQRYTADIFDFSDVDFDRWTFNTLDRPTITPARRRAKKVKLFGVRVQNDAQEPFGIFALQMEYRIGGRIRR